MRKDEPDSKYFGEIPENEVFRVKSWKTTQKLHQRFTVVFPEGLMRLDFATFPASGKSKFKIDLSQKVIGVGTSCSNEKNWSVDIHCC